VKVGGTVASWLVRSTPDQVVWVRVPAGDIVLCCWAKRFTLTLPLSTRVYKRIMPSLMLGLTLRLISFPIQEGVEIFLVTSCFRNVCGQCVTSILNNVTKIMSATLLFFFIRNYSWGTSFEEFVSYSWTQIATSSQVEKKLSLKTVFSTCCKKVVY